MAAVPRGRVGRERTTSFAEHQSVSLSQETSTLFITRISVSVFRASFIGPLAFTRGLGHRPVRINLW